MSPEPKKRQEQKRGRTSKATQARVASSQSALSRVQGFVRRHPSFRSLKIVGPLVTVMGIAASLPSISITAEDVLRPRDMLSTPFTIRNESPWLPIRTVRFLCQVDTIATSTGQLIQNVRLGERDLATTLGPNQSVSANCAIPGWTGNILGTIGRQQAVRVSLRATYRLPWTPIRRKANAGFRAVPSYGGRMAWIGVEPIPIWKPIIPEPNPFGAPDSLDALFSDDSAPD